LIFRTRSPTTKTAPKPDHDDMPPPGNRPLFVCTSNGFPEYRLLDSGLGRKLERYGKIVIDRPEPQAMWSPRLASKAWEQADAVFDGDDEEGRGRWRYHGRPPENWPMQVGPVSILCQFSAFRHVGIFPEQMPLWDWMLANLKSAQRDGQRPRLLNLFGYTGVASLLAAADGVEVTHVDASKKAIQWAKQNQAQSKLQDAPIRWILEDARKFVEREVRRGRTYHGILIDPPKFGRGAEGEVWDLFEDLPRLLRACEQLLDRSSSFLILNTYAIRASALSIDLIVRESLSERGGVLESGELAVSEENGDRALSMSLFARWTNQNG
jgi:23S rRNA (cytosine1962-C5)-methyltransferase